MKGKKPWAVIAKGLQLRKIRGIRPGGWIGKSRQEKKKSLPFSHRKRGGNDHTSRRKKLGMKLREDEKNHQDFEMFVGKNINFAVQKKGKGVSLERSGEVWAKVGRAKRKLSRGLSGMGKGDIKDLLEKTTVIMKEKNFKTIQRRGGGFSSHRQKGMQ